jgi:hypothetical protein
MSTENTNTPDIIKTDDCELIYLNGALHSLTSPAIKYNDGREEWWKNGQRHRDGDLPAVLMFDCKEWWKDGERHRDNGEPAVLKWREEYRYHGRRETNINQVIVKEWWVHNQLVKRESCSNNKIEYFNRGKLHREDGPAVESPTRTEWWKDGQKHREGDLPAIEVSATGYQEWWKNNKRHRDGDLPAVVGQDGTHQEYWKDGRMHRDGGKPAMILSGNYNYSEVYYVNGQKHRLRSEGPAVVARNDGISEYWENGRYLFNSTIFNKLKHVFSLRQYFKEQRQLKKLKIDEEYTPVLREPIADAKGDLFYLRKNDTEAWAITRNEAKSWFEFAKQHNRPVQNHYTTMELTQWEQKCVQYYLGAMSSTNSSEKLYHPVDACEIMYPTDPWLFEGIAGRNRHRVFIGNNGQIFDNI